MQFIKFRESYCMLIRHLDQLVCRNQMLSGAPRFFFIKPNFDDPLLVHVRKGLHELLLCRFKILSFLRVRLRVCRDAEPLLFSLAFLLLLKLTTERPATGPALHSSV